MIYVIPNLYNDYDELLAHVNVSDADLLHVSAAQVSDVVGSILIPRHRLFATPYLAREE